MTDKEALKLALEALERLDLWLKARYSGIGLVGVELEAITAIKEALAQPEQETVQRLSALVRAQQITIDKLEAQSEQPSQQEPVAWITKTGNVWKTKADETDTPLYTTPPQRKPLTDEEIDELSRSMVKGDKSVNWLCRAIEAAHGIKE